MSQPISVDILSEDEDEEDQHLDRHDDAVSTPLPIQPKRPRTDSNCYPSVFVIDDDPTPGKTPAAVGSESTPLFVAETPMSELDVAVVKGTKEILEPRLRPCSTLDPKLPGICRLICLESDNESENGFECKTNKQDEKEVVGFERVNDSLLRHRFLESTFSSGDADVMHMPKDSLSQPNLSDGDIPQVHCHIGGEVYGQEATYGVSRERGSIKDITSKKENVDGAMGQKRMTKEERISLTEDKKQIKEQERFQKAALKAEAAEARKLQQQKKKWEKGKSKVERIPLMEEKKQQKEQERLQKAALKAEVAKKRKLEKEKKKWEKGKSALKSIVANIDIKVVELGSIGGHLLTRFAEKGITYRVTSNPIERSILWTMHVPEHIVQLSSQGVDIPYVLVIYKAEEFCDIVMKEAINEHISRVRSHYPSYTICYLTNRLMAYINKRDHEQYKNPSNYTDWEHPPVEEVLSKLTTHFYRVHSRQCIDEAEVAEHVVGLTYSLASCQFRKKLTPLSVNANGSLIPKDCVDKDIIKKSSWLKALIAIPKVQPRFAIAIWKKYPTMKSLLSVYMDPSKSVHEKEFLLKELTTEGLLGDDRRLGEICSKRVYRILMAQCGSVRTDDVEDGADFFSHQSS